MPVYHVISPVRVPGEGIVRDGTVELPQRRARQAVRNGSLRRRDAAPANGGQGSGEGSGNGGGQTAGQTASKSGAKNEAKSSGKASGKGGKG